MQEVSAISLHRGVRPLLVPQGARVEGAHQRALNLRLESGALLTLCAPALGNGPGALLVEADWPLPWRVGERLAVGPLAIAGPGLRVELAGAAQWSEGAPPGLGPLALVRQGWYQSMAELGRAAKSSAGLAPLALAEPDRGAAPAGPGPSPLHDLARPGLHALASRDWDAAVAGLVGLGPGLTPSGDDLLSGFLLLALRTGWSATAAPLSAALRALPPGRTTPVSESLLRWATEGVANERALHWLDGLIRGAPPPLAPVLAIGATSGADWASGALLALDLLLKEAGA